MAKKIDLIIVKSDDKKFSATFTDSAGAAVNLTAASISFTVKDQWPTPQVQIFQKTVGSGITITDATGGKADIDVVPADTSSVSITSSDRITYIYDLEVTTGAGLVYTAARGNFTILAESS